MVKLRHLLKTLFICSTLMIGCAFAQSSLTQIRDTVTNVDGTPFNGTVIVTWNGFLGLTGGTVSPLSTSARISNGALSILLVPSTTASTGTFYQATFNSNNGTVTWTETWQVPPSTVPLTLSQVRTSTSTGTGPASGGTGTGSSGTGSSGTGSSGTGSSGTGSSISMTQVTGLSSEIASIDSSLSSVTGSINTLNTTTNTLTTNVGTINTSLSGLSSTVSGVATTVTGLSNTVSALTSTLNGLSSSAVSVAFKDGDVPSGTINGTNRTFNLAAAPSPSGSLSLYRNGLLQSGAVDYTVAGSVVTFTANSVPTSGDVLLAYYRIAGTGSPTTFTDAETPAGTINGTNLVFTVAVAPSPASSLKLYRNGILLMVNGDYTLSGSTITFTGVGAAPQTGDTLTAAYRH